LLLIKIVLKIRS